MSYESIIGIIAPVSGNLQTVRIQGDDTKRGATGKPPSSGIYIRRNGTVTGSASGSELTITLEGGSPLWEGAVNDDGILPYFTSPQLSLIGMVKNYIRTMTNANIEEDYHGK